MRLLRFASMLLLASPGISDVEVISEGIVEGSADDEHPRCFDWARRGECRSNPRYMLRFCKLACAEVATDDKPFMSDQEAATEALGVVTSELAPLIGSRLSSALEGTLTQQCRDEVTSAFLEHARAFVSETPFPFQSTTFTTQCKGGERRDIEPPPAAEDVRIAYLLLVHEKPEQASRLIGALNEARHHFVVHVDGKAPARVAKRLRLESEGGNVHVMPDALRRNISWGGFEMVQATLNGMRYATEELGLDYDWIINLSGSTYPLQPNSGIVSKLASLESRHVTLMEVDPTPSRYATRLHLPHAVEAVARVTLLSARAPPPSGRPRPVPLPTLPHLLFTTKASGDDMALLRGVRPRAAAHMATQASSWHRHVHGKSVVHHVPVPGRVVHF